MKPKLNKVNISLDGSREIIIETGLLAETNTGHVLLEWVIP